MYKANKWDNSNMVRPFRVKLNKSTGLMDSDYTLDEWKLMKRLPKKYLSRFYRLEREDGLIDNCKYMLYLDNGWTWGEYNSIPVKSITEAISFIKDSWETKYNEK